MLELIALFIIVVGVIVGYFTPFWISVPLLAVAGFVFRRTDDSDTRSPGAGRST